MDNAGTIPVSAATVKALHVHDPPTVAGRRRVKHAGVVTKQKPTTLYALLDCCNTTTGSRMLYDWLREPLKEKNDIERRLDCVDVLLNNVITRRKVETTLAALPEIASLINDFKRNMRKLNNVYKLVVYVRRMDYVAKTLTSAEELHGDPKMIDTLLKTIAVPILDLTKLLMELVQTFDDFVERDVEQRTDDHFRLKASIDENMAAHEKHLQAIESEVAAEVEKMSKRLGVRCSAMSVDHSFAYRITKKSESAIRGDRQYVIVEVKAGYVAFQNATLNEINERYYVALSEYLRIHDELVQEFFETTVLYEKNSCALVPLTSALDALCALARVAEERCYCRPTIDGEEGNLILRECRHPLVELWQEDYVPNEVALSAGGIRTLIVSGPNEGGKSTYMRSIGVAAFMAHIGSFVACAEARIPIFDGIYTRMGAEDRLFEGKSTFAVEMEETNLVLKNATAKSLVLIDELGRGTSSDDGYGLAYAIVSHLTSTVRCMTIFATHFEELGIMLQIQLPRHVALLYAQVIEDDKGKVHLTHRMDRQANSLGSFSINTVRNTRCPQQLCDKIVMEVERVNKEPEKMTRIAEEHPAVVTAYQLKEARDVSTWRQMLDRLDGVNIERIQLADANRLFGDTVPRDFVNGVVNGYTSNYWDTFSEILRQENIGNAFSFSEDTRRS